MERHEVIEILEELRQNMVRIGTAGTGDLNDHDDDGERHADVIKRIDKAVVHEHEVQRAYHAGQDEPSGRDALDADIVQAAKRGDERLKDTDAEEEREASEVALDAARAAELGVIHRHLYHRRREERADEQRQHYVVR